MKNDKKINSGTRPALAMLLCSCIAFSAAASYIPPQEPPAVAAAVPSGKATVLSSAVTGQETQKETSTPETTAEKAYEPAPYILNLAYQYPEGSEESYAEILMKELIQKDSQWYAEIYDMANTAPKKMAVRLGKPAASVLGKYNPTSKDQNEKDPSTWSVEHFKNVRVSFYNGDGDVTSAVSNAQDILSMASVYAYYNGITDIDQIRSYVNQLWNLSHSYSTSMGDVYYCDGCVNPDEGEEESDSELENEDTFREGRTIDTEIHAAPVETSGDETESETDGDISSEEASSQSAEIPMTAAASTDTAASITAADPASPAGTSEASVSAESEGSVSQENKNTESVPEVTLIEEETSTALIIRDEETSPKETTEFIWDPETEAPPIIIRLDDETEDSSKHAESTESASAENSSEAAAPSESEEGTSPQESTVTASASEALDTSAAKKNSGAVSKDSSGKICPGHVDLKITAKIYTLSEKSNLYSLDQKGNAVEDGAKWPGWTSKTKAFVRHINRQSWADEYDLNVTLPGTRAPLSTTEIDSYMNQLPADTTEERKNIIRFALQSVGKVPYYWGGKPDSRNYSGNSFGSVTIPDHRGRILKGLDCSGWINWVYWSATGNRLPYEGTEGLKTTGSQIARQDLKPGDIVVITGSTPHVIMFMNWTADGQIQCVHETGSANNVTVGVMTANWPYYRNLLD